MPALFKHRLRSSGREANNAQYLICKRRVYLAVAADAQRRSEDAHFPARSRFPSFCSHFAISTRQWQQAFTAQRTYAACLHPAGVSHPDERYPSSAARSLRLSRRITHLLFHQQRFLLRSLRLLTTGPVSEVSPGKGGKKKRGGDARTPAPNSSPTAGACHRDTPHPSYPLFSFVEDAQVRFFFFFCHPVWHFVLPACSNHYRHKSYPHFLALSLHGALQEKKNPTCGSKWNKKSLSFISLVACFIEVINHPSHPPTPLLVLHSLTFQGSHLAIAFIPELVSQILVETSDSVEWLFDLILLQQTVCHGRGQTMTNLSPHCRHQVHKEDDSLGENWKSVGFILLSFQFLLLVFFRVLCYLVRTDCSPVVVELQVFKFNLRFIIFPMSTWMSRSSISFHFKAFAVAALFRDSIQYTIETVTDKYVCRMGGVCTLEFCCV